MRTAVGLRVEHDRDRAVVDDLDEHAGAEDAGFDGDAQGAQLAQKCS
jgi:hypothetical protein